MKLTLWKGKAPATGSARTVASVQESFAEKLGRLRKATGRPERFVSHCACALHDRPFVVVYERTDPTMSFTLASVHTDGDDMNVEVRKESMNLFRLGPPRKSVAAAELDLTGWRCPHCGCADYVIACQSCGTTVCGGRTVSGPGRTEVFHCRASCGAHGSLTDSTVVHGVDGTRKAAPQLGAPSSRTEALPRADRLRLNGPK